MPRRDAGAGLQVFGGEDHLGEALAALDHGIDVFRRVHLEVEEDQIAPAAEARPETAHHHLYLDVDFPQAETAIPMGTEGVVHLGQAQKEYHWENVAPGNHRIIAVLADPGHIPLRPYVTDTVNFVVKAPPPADSTTKK